jgi:hypothetical protein
MKNKLFKIVLLLTISFTVISCYTNDTIPIEDLDTVSTIYKAEDFNPAPSTTFIVWDVVQIENDDEDDIPYDGEADAEILNTTLDKLVSIYGIENVTIISETENPTPTPSNPNVQIISPEDPEPSDPQSIYLPSIILREKTVGTIYPGYPWYPGWWGPCFYCWYPPVIDFNQYDVGTVVLDFIDLRNIDEVNNPGDLSPSWIAEVRGLLSTNATINSQRIISGINQAFNQSPYLN